MNIKTALEKANYGDTIKRPNWPPDHFISFENDEYESDDLVLSIQDLKADDYEIVSADKEDGPIDSMHYAEDNSMTQMDYIKTERDFKAGETNDRKRTQPVIDDYMEFLEEARSSEIFIREDGVEMYRFGDKGLYKSAIDKSFKALKTLEENEK